MNVHSRVLMVTPRFKPAIGGIEKHLESACRILHRKSFDITMLTQSHERGLSSTEIMEGLKICRIPFGWEKNPFLVYIWMILNWRKFSGYDIVHVHGTIQLLLWYLPLRFIQFRTPTYATFHGYERDPVPVHFRILRRVARRLVRGVICIGHFIPKAYSIVCDCIITGAVERPSLPHQSRKGAILVGRVERDIGILEYIEALGILEKTHGISLPLTICGAGSMEKEAAELAASLSVNVKFLGIVDNPIESMNSKQICLAAGYLSMLEAMSLGLPVIGIARSSLRAAYLKGILKDGGPISIQTTAEGIAREIARLIESPQLAEDISVRGRKFAESLSWNRMVRTYLDLWTGVA